MLEDEPVTHIYPIGDIKPHFGVPDCRCGPEISYEEGEMIVRHVAFDGRPSPHKKKKPRGDIVSSVEVMLGYRCKDCLEYINKEGEHIPPPLLQED